jgi:hypothetical protein
MKRYLYLSVIIAACLLNSCAKSPASKEDTKPVTVTPQIAIHSLMLPNFSGSIWTPAMVGNVRLELDQVNSKDSVLSMIQDSASFANFSLYQKIVPKGTYNITYSSGTTAAADTFMRFSGQLKGLVVDKKQTLDLTASSNDGVITIDKNFIANGTVPAFKPDSGTKTYKLGLSNGFYYLYVKGGVKGNINFVAKATGQTVGKQLSVKALNQLNMAVVNNKGSLQIIFVPFTANTMKVSSNTLAIINVNPYFLYNNPSTWFVATDENGNILSEVKYVQGTTTFKMDATKPFEKDRFSLYRIEIRTGGTVPGITGYLQIKKGSTIKVDFPGPTYHHNTLMKVHLNNVTSFDQLLISSNESGISYNSTNDTTDRITFGYQDTTRLWVQMLKNNSYKYNMFDIPKGTIDYSLDINKIIKTPLVKSYSVPGNNLNVIISALSDLNWGNAYDFGYQSTQYGNLDYHYPVEPFKYYITRIAYDDNQGYTHSYFNTGPTIPDNIPEINATFTVSGSTLADFVPHISGDFDYYRASFLYGTGGPYMQVDLYSPATANYTVVKLPDFSRFLGFQTLDLRTQKLESFELVKSQTFDENKFTSNIFAGGYTQTGNYRTISKRFQ